MPTINLIQVLVDRGDAASLERATRMVVESLAKAPASVRTSTAAAAEWCGIREGDLAALLDIIGAAQVLAEARRPGREPGL